MRKKAKWIQKKCDELLDSRRILDGNKALYMGDYHDVDLLTPSGTLKEWMTRETESLVKERLADFEKRFKFSHNGFLVRDMKKWGYCTKDKRLAFSWQLAALPRELADYVILHELAHLREFSHSRRFKYLLAAVCPDFKEREKRLSISSPNSVSHKTHPNFKLFSKAKELGRTATRVSEVIEDKLAEGTALEIHVPRQKGQRIRKRISTSSGFELRLSRFWCPSVVS